MKFKLWEITPRGSTIYGGPHEVEVTSLNLPFPLPLGLKITYKKKLQLWEQHNCRIVETGMRVGEPFWSFKNVGLMSD